MPERSKRYSLLIFLFALFIILSLYIGFWSYALYTSSKNYTQTTSRSSLTCSQYSFKIIENTINYKNSTLSFDIDISNMISYADQMKKLILLDGEAVESEPINFYLRTTKVVFKNVKIQESFMISPAGCETSNVKKCSISAQKCQTTIR